MSRGFVTAGGAVVERRADEEPRSCRFFRRNSESALDFDATDDGFTPNFVKRKDDLDVPAFLRKQMD